jgi:HAD superfamily hydrolase (TIGR01490 family)
MESREDFPESAAPPAQAAAFFDVDGTLVRSNIVHYFMYFRRREMSPAVGSAWQTWFWGKCLGYLVMDKLSRSWLNKVFYRNYRGMDAETVRAAANSCFQDVICPKLFPGAADGVGAHFRQGRRIVLVTGSIDFIMKPLADYLGENDADVDMLAPALRVEGGRFTGQLDGPPVGEAEKARRIQAYAAAHDLDLSACFAYGDSIADLPMLEAVGHPTAVHPDRALARVAVERGWPIVRW